MHSQPSARTLHGTAGYAEAAPELAVHWGKLTFENVHAGFLDLLPETPKRVLDVGSGTGRDAIHLARSGHHVTACEPVDALREIGCASGAGLDIRWLDDGLPDLKAVFELDETYDVVIICGVWHHLNLDERSEGLPRIAQLMRPNALLLLSLRHGPVPSGRVAFPVSIPTALEQAERAGLSLVRRHDGDSIQQANRKAGVTWTRFAFRKRV
ncbi:MAG: class I SAM-dependent methyltransferase [Pseudomonadota bacterium]